MKKLSILDRLRERYHRFDSLCEWWSDHWEDVALYVLASGVLVTFVFIIAEMFD